MPNFSTISPLVILFILCVFSFYYLQGIETNLINNSLKVCGHLDIFLLSKCKTVNSTCFIAHNTTDLKIVSLNVRGLGNNAKRKEVFNWLRAKKQSIYICCERSIVLKTLPIYGLMSGGTKRSSAAAAATKQGLVLFSTIISISRSTRFSRIQMDDF